MRTQTFSVVRAAASQHRAAAMLHPALRARLRRTASRQPGNAGSVLLSVIVPMHNVAPYLDRCLSSLVSQTYRRLEIILVDDGSTDRTGAIAAGYARYDRRIKLVRLPHGGNGKARNIGVERARGRFLAFADADDVVPSDAYSLMMASLARTGSDFCIGSYGRIRGSKRTPVRLAERIHAVPSTGVTLAERPDVIDDVFLWNKVFQRKFWDRAVGRIPEGIRYEDQESTARAYLRSGSFDILTPVVYWWRIREDGTSITQAKHLLEDLQDRLTVARDVTALMAAEATQAVQAHWYRRLLGTDLIPYIEQVPDAGGEFWQMLRDGLRDLYAGGQPHLGGIDPQSRILLYLVAGGHQEDVRRAVVDRINNGTASPLAFDGGGILARPPLVDVLKTTVPPRLLVVAPEQLELVTVLEPPLRGATGQAVLRGHAYVRNVDLRSNEVTLTVKASDTAGQRGIRAFRRYSNPEIDLATGDRNCSYADSAFSMELDLPLPKELSIAAEVAGHRVECMLRVPSPADGAGLRPAGPTVTALSALSGDDGDELRLELAGAPPDASYALVTARYQLPAKALRQPDGKLLLRVPLATQRWGMNLPAPPSGSYTLRMRGDGGAAGPGDPAVAVDEATAGGFRSIRLADARVRGLRTDAGVMAVSISAPLADEETGTFHQYRLRRAVFGAGTVALCPGIFFESFGGTSCSDNPRAISDYLAATGFGEPLYWSVADRSVPVPEYAVALLQGSAEWYEKLATTRRLVNNNNFPWYFRKSPGQFYLQTWHGTPMKKLGLDVPQNLLALSYRDLMQREARWWDLLLAQNTFAAATLPRALGYTGEVLTAGYPRGDALLRSDTRERVRSRLGISPGQTVLLYVPTWRDGVRDGAGRSDWIGFLDVAEVSGRLGPKCTFLIRGHHNVAAQRNIAEHPRTIDVTDYPDVNDLYLASDALVTDYSSAIFDYAELGRPIFLLAPDLEQFRQSRGLYLNPMTDLPGIPLVSTSTELAAAVAEGFGSGHVGPSMPARLISDTHGDSSAAVAAGLLGRSWPAPDRTELTGDLRG
ncbi:CDP-glycerol glycerophosphotransferase family protein [Arthrobacter yangruifuii]|uniref:CDP-glycerol glycerophosphotransferase family protein n=1 Tax=Arthrobacter yangruifuii TaxID=2606616 RepID=UPI0011B76A3E